MPLPWLHPDRVEVLSALAVAAAGREPLATGFARLAADEPVLRPWVARLAPLERGAQAVPLLHRLRLIDDAQAAWLAAREGTARFAAGLERAAASLGHAAPGFAPVRDFPLLVFVAVTAVPWLVWTVIETMGVGPGSLRETWGLAPDTITAFLEIVPRGWQVVVLLATYALLWLGLRACWYQPVLRHAMVLWSPAVFRAALACRLVVHAWRGSHAAPELGERVQRRLERLLRLPGSEPEAPAWRRDWRLFWFLTWFRLERGRRSMLFEEAQQVDLTARLRVLGLLVDDEHGRVDWDASLHRAQDALTRTLAARRAWLWAVVGLATLLAFLNRLQSLMLDLVSFGYAGDWPGPTLASLDYLMLHLVLAAAAVGVAALGQVPWIPSLLVAWGHQPRAGGRICAALADALRARGELADALDALVLELPACYRRRLRAAAAELRRGGDLVAILAAHRLLPSRRLRDLRAAASLGPAVLERTCTAIADGLAPEDGGAQAATAGLLPYLLLLLGVVGYLGVVILPRFDRMFRSLKIDLPPVLQAYLDLVGPLGPWRWVILIGGLLAVAWGLRAVVWSGCSWWPGAHAIARGRVLLSGLAVGASEAELARSLAASWRRPPPALAAAGATGDLPALIRCCGWRAHDAAGLARCVGRAEARRQALGRLGLALVWILAPLVLALPVLLLAQGLFQAFARVLLELIP